MFCLLDTELPPAKKRKLDITQIENTDPSIIIPKLNVSSVSNGIVQIKFLNIDSFYEQEIHNHNVYQFELMYKCNNNEWKSIKYLNHAIACYECFYLKVLIDIQDYTLHFKLRSKLQNLSDDKWSLFCDIITIKIPSSLIAHQFKIGDYAEFRAPNEYYSREGRIIKLLDDNKVRIRPFPKHLLTNPNPIINNNNSDNENDTMLRYADLDYFFPFEDNDSDNHNHNEEPDEIVADNDFMMNMLQVIESDGDENDEIHEERLHILRRNLRKYKDRKCVGDIDIHCSRLYGDGIRLSGVIDISNNEINIDKMILLKCDNENIINIYNTLKDIYYNYAVIYVSNGVFVEHSHELKCIGRFFGKNICDFLIENDIEYKWKINCLRDSNDGKMCLNSVRCDIIQARIDGLKDKVEGMKLYDIDSIVGFCDLCRLEINDYDWRYNCEQHITNKHDICMTCAYNVINQYIQFNGLLYPLLKNQLNDDCIQEITSFVVGSVVKL